MVAAVILAAGRGERFAREGFSVPKPLIMFRGRTLLAHTLEAVARILPEPNSRMIVVCTEPVKPSVPSQHTVQAVTHIQPGPAASAALTLGNLDPDEPVAFFDCDNVFEGWLPLLPWGRNFVVAARLTVPDLNFGCVVERPGGSIALEEKTGASALAVAGIYGFATADIFRKAFYEVAATRGADQPMSAVLNAAIKHSPTAGLSVLIDAARWTPVGTPQQLAEAQK